MGYRYDINEVKIRVDAAKVPQMIQVLGVEAKAHIKNDALWRIRQNKERLENDRNNSEFYVSKLNGEIKEKEEILRSLPDRELSREEIFKNLQWSYDFDESGSLVSMYHSGETKDVNEEELESISPFVSDGSYVEVVGDDFDDIFRFIFRNGKMQRIHAVISFPEDEE